jgi:dimethylhistidine N-methyltransferase
MPLDLSARFPDRFSLHQLAPTGPSRTFADDVRTGLGTRPRTLLPKYFYDDLGSKLFEAICCLPEYYLTRAESEILRNYSAEIVDSIGIPVRVVELGSGSADKTRYLIEALLARQNRLHYLPVDISPASLEHSSNQLLHAYPQLAITAYAADYFGALGALRERRSDRRERTVVLFLGSNIGNFDPDESLTFLTAVRRMLDEGDAMLLGADLKKSSAELIPAYYDPLGVTAAFNLNLLLRINRELDGDFDVSKFQHWADYDEEAGRIEMYLVSRVEHWARIRALDLELDFVEGETIHTENSYKFDLEQIRELAERSGFVLARTWMDSAARFSFNLLVSC